jgi:hypothetical protein
VHKSELVPPENVGDMADGGGDLTVVFIDPLVVTVLSVRITSSAIARELDKTSAAAIRISRSLNISAPSFFP